MFLIRNQPAKSSIFLCRCTQSQPNSSGYGQIYSAEKFFFLCERQREGGQRRWREQMCFSSGSSLPLSCLFHHSHDCSLYYSHCQVPLILPHSSSLYYLQEKLSLVLSARGINNSKTSLLPSLYAQSKVAELAFRGFSSFNGAGVGFDVEIDENFENVDTESDTEDAKIKSKADPLEVSGIFKVIDELFAFNRNMGAVLDGYGINLSHDLVVDVLGRFAHDSRTYISMLSILGKNGQFETMVSLLEEMGERGLLRMDTFSIAMRAFAASKEMTKVIGIFELMKEYKYKVGVGTINSLLDSLGRARLGKEALAFFDKLEGRFMPNLETYTVLLNGWCKVKTLMEAGRIWNEMIDKGFKPDTGVHNIMLEGLLKSKKMSEAIKLLMAMKSKGPSSQARSYRILIRDLCKQSKMNEVIKYFEEMVDSGWKPDAAVYKC